MPLRGPYVNDSGGTMASMSSWLVRLPPDQAGQVQALAKNVVFCFWARHLTITVPLSTWMYKWVPSNLVLRVPLRCINIPSREK